MYDENGKLIPGETREQALARLLSALSPEEAAEALEFGVMPVAGGSELWSILKDALITRVSNAVTAGTSEVDSTALDMQNFNSVLFIVGLNTVVDNCVMTATIKSNPTNSNSGGTTEKAGTAVTAATSSNKTMAVEMHKPTQRFVYLAFTRTAQNATLDGIWAIQFNPSSVPQTQTILAADVGGPGA